MDSPLVHMRSYMYIQHTCASAAAWRKGTAARMAAPLFRMAAPGRVAPGMGHDGGCCAMAATSGVAVTTGRFAPHRRSVCQRLAAAPLASKLCRKLYEELYDYPRNKSRYSFIPWFPADQAAEEIAMR